MGADLPEIMEERLHGMNVSGKFGEHPIHKKLLRLFHDRSCLDK
jgi:hypothetical protein